jgi:Protein of unknown function (DUF2917)
MEEYIVQGSLGLTRGSLLRIEDGRDILLYVWEGEVWLTEERERQDLLLRAGQWHRLERQGAAIGYALERSVVTLTAPEPAQYARRVLLVKAGDAAPVELYNASRERMHWLVQLGAQLRRRWAGLFAPYSRPTTASL